MSSLQDRQSSGGNRADISSPSGCQSMIEWSAAADRGMIDLCRHEGHEHRLLGEERPACGAGRAITAGDKV
jgi:hypothetical protein